MPRDTGDEMTGARYIAAALERLGVSHVFFMDAILRPTLAEMERSTGIARILAHSEKAAAYMADGYARASGRVGVCMAQSVGAANLAAGLQDAFLHRAPVIAITGRKEAMLRHRNAYQEVEHRPLFRPVTKDSLDVAEARELPHLMAQAFRAATEGSPRPVHLDLAGLGGEMIEQGILAAPALPDPALGALPAHRPVAPPLAIAKAAARLAEAARPVLVAGAGAIQAGAEGALRVFAETMDIPIATSLGGRGIVPTTHPNHVGTVGTYSAPPGNRIVAGADVVIYVGCHVGEQPTNAYTVPRPGTPIIQLDIDGLEIGRCYSNTLSVLGCPRAALEALTEKAAPKPEWADWAREARGIVAAWREETAPALASDAAPIRVERLCAEISAALPEDGILVADTGYSGIWTATLLDLPHAPRQSYLRAAGSLGWAFPAALGAQCAAPDRPVVCFTGDGALYYHLAELETQRRWQIPAVTVVNNNSGFGQGIYKVKAIYGDRKGRQGDLNRFGPTDFAALARTFGVDGIRVEDPAALGPALRDAIAARRPALIDVITDIDPRAPEPWQPPG